MTIIEYLDAVKDRLTVESTILDFSIVRERATLVDGHLRARMTMTNGGTLEFSEYVQRAPDGQIDVATYSYHWADVNGDLIRRWDNTPHFPEMPGFPHHVHDGRNGSVVPGKPVNILLVLDEVSRLLAQAPTS